MREIIESDNFTEAVRVLGGHRAVDEALEPVIEARPGGRHGMTHCIAGLRRVLILFDMIEYHISVRLNREHDH